MGEKNSTGVEYILLNAKRRKRHYFERVEIRTCHFVSIYIVLYAKLLLEVEPKKPVRKTMLTIQISFCFLDEYEDELN